MIRTVLTSSSRPLDRQARFAPAFYDTMAGLGRALSVAATMMVIVSFIIAIPFLAFSL